MSGDLIAMGKAWSDFMGFGGGGYGDQDSGAEYCEENKEEVFSEDLGNFSFHLTFHL